MREFHILNLGAGVQSTTVALLQSFDAAIFADTQEEPTAVYSHLDWLEANVAYSILRRTIGRLGDDLLGVSKKLRFASIPAFAGNSKAWGTARRNCSRDYKSRVVEQTIRREICGLEPKRGLPKGIEVHQYFGISRDEARRAVSIRERIDCKRGWFSHFPLLEKGWTRADCLRFLAERVPHQVPRSACVFCPYHSDSEWRAMRERPDEWARAVLIDKALRDPATLARRGLREPLYLHPSRKPLDEVDFDAQSTFPNFAKECEGMCGV
jgi:hypothetical protein